MINVRSTQRFTSPGAHVVTLPHLVTHILIHAEGGPIRYAFDEYASADSAGFVPPDQHRTAAANNFSSFSVYVPSGSIANCTCYGR